MVAGRTAWSAGYFLSHSSATSANAGAGAGFCGLSRTDVSPSNSFAAIFVAAASASFRPRDPGPARFALRRPWWSTKTHQAPFHSLTFTPTLCLLSRSTDSLHEVHEAHGTSDMSSSATEVTHHRVHDPRYVGLSYPAVRSHPGVEFRTAHEDLAAEAIVGQGMSRVLEMLTELPDAQARVARQRPKRQKRVQGTAEDNLLGQDASDLSHGRTRSDWLAPFPRWLSSVLRLAQPTALGVHASRRLASGSRSGCGLEPTPAGLLGREGSLATGLDDSDQLKRLERARISRDLGGERR